MTKKPIIFFDLETSGIDKKKDRILELYAIKYFDEKPIDEIHLLFDPVVEIDQSASELHGYTNEMLKGKPRFEDVADQVFDFFDGSDLAGYNIINFDVPFLVDAFLRTGKKYRWSKVRMIDLFNIWKMKEGRKLSDAYKKFTGKEMDDNAHQAKYDIECTFEIFKKMSHLWEEDFKDVETLDDLSKMSSEKEWLDLNRSYYVLKDDKELKNAYLGFGKYKGHLLSWVLENDPNYFDYCQKIAKESPSTDLVFQYLKKTISKT